MDLQSRVCVDPNLESDPSIHVGFTFGPKGLARIGLVDNPNGPADCIAYWPKCPPDSIAHNKNDQTTLHSCDRDSSCSNCCWRASKRHGNHPQILPLPLPNLHLLKTPPKLEQTSIPNPSISRFVQKSRTRLQIPISRAEKSVSWQSHQQKETSFLFIYCFCRLVSWIRREKPNLAGDCEGRRPCPPRAGPRSRHWRNRVGEDRENHPRHDLCHEKGSWCGSCCTPDWISIEGFDFFKPWFLFFFLTYSIFSSSSCLLFYIKLFECFIQGFFRNIQANEWMNIPLIWWLLIAIDFHGLPWRGICVTFLKIFSMLLELLWEFMGWVHTTTTFLGCWWNTRSVALISIGLNGTLLKHWLHTFLKMSSADEVWSLDMC